MFACLLDSIERKQAVVICSLLCLFVCQLSNRYSSSEVKFWVLTYHSELMSHHCHNETAP